MSRHSGATCFIGNIPYEVSEQQLTDLFAEVGPVKSLRLVADRESGKPKGYGFCEFYDAVTAESAMRNLNGYDVGGRSLRVDFADASGKTGPAAETRDSRRGGGGRALEQGGPVPSRPGSMGLSSAATAAGSMAAALGDYGAAAAGGPSDKLTQTLANMTREELHEVMTQMKDLVSHSGSQARGILIANPQLTKALFQAEIMLGMVKNPLEAVQQHRPQTPPPQQQQNNPPPPQPPMHQQQQQQPGPGPAMGPMGGPGGPGGAMGMPPGGPNNPPMTMGPGGMMGGPGPMGGGYGGNAPGPPPMHGGPPPMGMHQQQGGNLPPGIRGGQQGGGMGGPMGGPPQQDMGSMGGPPGPPPPHMQGGGGGGGPPPPHMQMGGGGGDNPMGGGSQQQQQLDAVAQQALLEQVMNLTPEQIDQLPNEHRQQVLALQQQLRQGGQ